MRFENAMISHYKKLKICYNFCIGSPGLQTSYWIFFMAEGVLLQLNYFVYTYSNINIYILISLNPQIIVYTFE